MKTINLERYGKVHPMYFNTAKYAENGNLYVGLTTMIDGWSEPWGDLTVNLSVKCDADCAFIDTNNNGDEIIHWLLENGIGILTGRERRSGWCVYPEFRFFMDKLKEFSAESNHVYDDVFEEFEFEDEEYISSCTNGDYSPSNPWDAPGMSIKDFI